MSSRCYGTSTATQDVAVGTVTLPAIASPGVGIATPIAGLAPGARANRFVILTNAGSIAGQALTMTVTGSTSALTGALRVSADACSVPWNASFACTGTTTSLLVDANLDVLLGGATTTIAATIPPGGTVNLRIGLSIPATPPVITTDGILTYQGTTTSITWTFTERQAIASTTNS